MKRLQTLCACSALALLAQAQLPYLVDFDDCTLPPGWTNTPTDSNFMWLFVLNSPDPLNAGSIDNTCMALFDDDALGASAAPTGAVLMSDTIEAIGFPDSSFVIKLDFDYNYFHVGNSSFVVELLSSPFPGGPFTADTLLNLSDNACGAWICGPPYPHFRKFLSSGYYILRFTYRDGGDFAGYAAIDNVSLKACEIAQLNPLSLEEPRSGCSLGMEKARITLRNEGGIPVDSARFKLNFDGVDITEERIVTSDSCGESFLLCVAPIDVDVDYTHEFQTPIDLSTPGIHSVRIEFETFSAGRSTGLDSAKFQVTNLPGGISTFPHTQTFDAWPSCFNSCTSSCTAQDEWHNASSDDTDWITDGDGNAVEHHGTGCGPHHGNR